MQRQCTFCFILRLTLLPVLFLFYSEVSGQSYYFSHFQVENGLSNNAVICSLQDTKGFLWFGTRDGLNRFDGLTFKTFRNDPEDPKSLGNNTIRCLHEENNETLWIGCERGLFKYDATTESFSVVNETVDRAVRDIQIDNKRNLWFISDLKLYKYNSGTTVTTSYSDLEHFDATAICTTSNGTLWIATSSGLIKKYDAATDSFQDFDMFSQSLPATSTWIENIYDTENGWLFVGTSSQGIKIFDIAAGTYRDVLTYNKDKTEIYARDFVKHSETEYWIATESGIFIYNILSKEFTNLRKQYGNPYSISDNAIYTFCKDREGGIFVGTYFGGVNYYPRQYTPFEKTFPRNEKNTISGNAVREICPDNYGNLWVGTEDAGLNSLELKNKTFTHFKPLVAQNSISNTNIHGLMANGTELWIGTFKRGLDVMDVRSGKVIRHYSSNTHSLKSDFIHCIKQTRSGIILVGTDKGLYSYNSRKDDFMLIKEVPGNHFYLTVLEDSKGTVWAGTAREGIYYFNPVTKKKGNYHFRADDKNSLSNNRVNGIFEDTRGRLWLATDDGLCKLNEEEQNFSRYTTKNGFPSNVIYRILEDDNYNLWVSTSKGLVCFNPVTEKSRTYTKAHGLLSDQFNFSSAYKDAEGTMFFGSVKGMVSFKPAAFVNNTFIPPVYITGFQVQNKDLAVQKQGSPLKKSITYTDKIILKHDQSSFNIDFAALSYTVPEMTEYAYKMEELDKDWTILKTYRKVFYTELSPGKYTFKVKASNSSGTWSDQETTLRIEILPPFWASSWAYLLYTLVSLFIFYYILKNYHRKAEEKHKRKIELLEIKKDKEIYTAKMEFFTNIAHEIRTPLTLIKGPLEKVMQKAYDWPDIKNYLKIMERNTNRLLDLTNDLLDFRKTETKSFSLNFVNADVSKLLEEIFMNFKPMAEQKNMSYRLNLPATGIVAHVDIEALNKILSNLINNAVKYGESRVNVCLLPLEGNDSAFQIEIKNDGYLIPADMQHKIFEPFFRIKETRRQLGSGIGLSLSRSLAELHRGILVLAKPENDLNVFLLSLPVRQDERTNQRQRQRERSLN
ncbi:MAG: two-component regulator propeller domain-containing protein [Chitinophagaceae bacterium]